MGVSKPVGLRPIVAWFEKEHEAVVFMHKLNDNGEGFMAIMDAAIEGLTKGLRISGSGVIASRIRSGVYPLWLMEKDISHGEDWIFCKTAYDVLSAAVRKWRSVKRRAAVLNVDQLIRDVVVSACVLHMSYYGGFSGLGVKLEEPTLASCSDVFNVGVGVVAPWHSTMESRAS